MTIILDIKKDEDKSQLIKDFAKAFNDLKLYEKG